MQVFIFIIFLLDILKIILYNNQAVKCGCGGMADTLVLGTSAYACRFKSCHPHHVECS